MVIYSKHHSIKQKPPKPLPNKTGTSLEQVWMPCVIFFKFLFHCLPLHLKEKAISKKLETIRKTKEKALEGINFLVKMLNNAKESITQTGKETLLK